MDEGCEKELDRIFFAVDLANGCKSIVFCATGISDSALLRGGEITRDERNHVFPVLMRAKSKTVRFIRATRDLTT